MSKVILWFTNNLRTSDNQAAFEASRTSDEIIPLYILDDTCSYPLGAASKWWLHHSLVAFEKKLKSKGYSLVLRKGNPALILQELVEETKAKAVYWNAQYEPSARKCEEEIKEMLKIKKVDYKVFSDFLLTNPFEIFTKTNTFYKSFTPFWNRCIQSMHIPPLFGDLQDNKFKKSYKTSSDNVYSWNLTPLIDWDKYFYEMWMPGEEGAAKRLYKFLKASITEYAEERDFPSNENGTSLLSPHLHFGEISIRQIWHAIQRLLNNNEKRKYTLHYNKFLTELGWREFSNYLLCHFPNLPSHPFVEKFDRFEWSDNKELFTAWTTGNTGYPIVDAGMRQLWSTGWMHNRVRMVVASFLTKDLLIDWRKGAAWFWETLVDADLANNSASWQWIAGCGADAAPYFRIFNPLLQSEKFDPEGEYIKRWVPELKNLPKKYIHSPSEAPGSVLKEAEIILGKTYPKPIVDHSEARKKALELYKTL